MGHRLNITLDDEYGEKLRRLAQQLHMAEGTLAASLLSSALDEADVDASSAVELLDGIPGALERARIGREQGRRGETIPLEEL